jgi:hypothetical protein
MATQFISNVERTNKEELYNNDGPGPGQYNPKLSKKVLPSFTGFNSSETRNLGHQKKSKDDKYSSPPSQIDAGLLMKTGAAVIPFKSKTQRFTDLKAEDEPGPGDYFLKPTISDGKPKKFAKQSAQTEKQISNMNIAKQSRLIVPSIPTKHQSYGYESNNKGLLVLQEPLIPGFDGTKTNGVGPGDYEPHVNYGFASNPAANFSRTTDRHSLMAYENKAAIGPGPGYYNLQTTFSKYDNDNPGNDSDFVLRIAASRKRQTASFESKTNRDGIFAELKYKTGPSPTTYSIPATITAPKPKATNLQFFTSSEERFKDMVPRSMRTHTAPGAYDPRTSDFENLALKIMKQKKIASRSSWAQNIAFAGTEERFHEGKVKVGPGPGAYRPKTEFHDGIAKENSRGGPFGTTSNRFIPPKDTYVTSHTSSMGDLGNGNVGGNSRNIGGLNPAAQVGNRPKFNAVFGSNDRRLMQEKPSDGPPPGAYDTHPSWKVPSSAVMVPSTIVSRKQQSKSPGPGQYNIATSLNKKQPNRKNIMMSSSGRENIVPKFSLSMPGPGTYNATPIYGNFIRPSYNVMLSEQ